MNLYEWKTPTKFEKRIMFFIMRVAEKYYRWKFRNG